MRVRLGTTLPWANGLSRGPSTFVALAPPLRICILELLRGGPLTVTQIREATSAPSSSVSQQLAGLRGRNILTAERRGTTIIYRVADEDRFELLDVARRIFNAPLSDTIDLLRLAADETGAADGTRHKRAYTLRPPSPPRII